MLDKETGAVKFPSWEILLSSDVTREAFLNSSLAKSASLQVENGEYCSWRLSPTKWDDKWWTTVVYFEGERLYQLILAASETQVNPGWEGWSEELERDMQIYYSTVLEKLTGVLGVKLYEFPWGTVETIYDERSAGSYIIIKYDKQQLEVKTSLNH
jgi:hypothetical protein